MTDAERPRRLLYDNLHDTDGINERSGLVRADACSVLHERIISQRSGTPVMCFILDSDRLTGHI